MKMGWGGVLVSLGLATGYDLGKFVQADYLHSASGRMAAPVRAELAAHSLARYCAEGRRPHADALLIQGLRDTLFPSTRACRSASACARAAPTCACWGCRAGTSCPRRCRPGAACRRSTTSR
ncbi:hypothetical protein [Pseudomonas sp. 273]|uniref:hypothetical protein n=1 Tax=Pseudomonas sp. 273 TaxID=75692 RepID=UPI0023D89631|nr:hypothetical protein [Pseudomonas sp. 273]